MVTAALSWRRSAPGDHTVTVSGGVATFTNLADDTAEHIALEFTSGGLAYDLSDSDRGQPGGGQPVAWSPGAIGHRDGRQAFSTQPVVYEEDRFGNLETGDNSTR